MTRDYDLIVVGGGGAGLAAAVSAHDAGARVLVVESEERLGGSTALAGGAFLAAGTSVQRANGIEGDAAEGLYTYYMTVCQWRANPAVVRRFCERAAPTIEWLLSLGVEFELWLTGVDTVRRLHRAVGKGAAIARTLEQACRAREIDTALKTRVDRLTVDESGAVAGIVSGSEEASANAVVVACGGFGQNGELLEKYFPDAWYEGRTRSVAAPGSRGDALHFARQVGAGIDGYNRGLFEPTPGVGQSIHFLFDWFVLVNRSGRRFMDESVYLSFHGPAILEQGGSCWAIFDEQARLDVGPHPVFQELFTGAPLSPGDPALQEYVDAGRVRYAESFEELARIAGMEPDVFASEILKYNEDCSAGLDSSFAKKPSGMRALTTPPYYAMEMVPGLVALTGCGLRTDPDARVLDTGGRVIPRLYAAGEASGSWAGSIYIGSGNSIGNAIIFGKIAGENAAKEVASAT